MRTLCFSLILAATAIVATPVSGALAQDAPQAQTAPAQSADAADSDAILVEGLTPRSEGDPPRGVPSINRRITGTLASHSEQFARCLGNIDPDQLREVIDGPPNEASTRFALDRLIRSHPACYPGLPMLGIVSEPYMGNCNPAIVGPNHKICRTIFDRGALMMMALERFAPGYTLTRERTGDAAVAARFEARETERNRYRYGADEKLAFVAACMVQLTPDLAVRMLRSDAGSPTANALQDAILSRANACVGYATDVRVDPSVFRAYVAEAVYRWLVAVRDVDSLIPADADD